MPQPPARVSESRACRHLLQTDARVVRRFRARQPPHVRTVNLLPLPARLDMSSSTDRADFEPEGPRLRKAAVARKFAIPRRSVVARAASRSAAQFCAPPPFAFA